jgi:phosphoglycerate dehydrogenase-like enzyme
MSYPVIVLPPNRNLEPDVVAIGRRLLPPGFELRLVSAEGLAAALPEADYLMGFIGPLDDAILACARRLRLVQLERRLRPVQLPPARRGSRWSTGGQRDRGRRAHHRLDGDARHLTELDAGVRAGRWSAGVKRSTSCGARRSGSSAWGIGREVAQRLRAWGATSSTMTRCA